MKLDLKDLISRKRIRYELGESTMPKRYRDFCLRVIDSERLTPTVFLNFNSQEDFTDKINKIILEGKDQGFSTKDISDKWHTFGDLYYHRMILTYIILKNYPNLSWKSKQHHDGTMFDDSFIVGINTPKGQYSYHYDLEHWDLFDIKELDKAPMYDGHKPEDIVRLISLL